MLSCDTQDARRFLEQQATAGGSDAAGGVAADEQPSGLAEPEADQQGSEGSPLLAASAAEGKGGVLPWWLPPERVPAQYLGECVLCAQQ